MNQIIQTAIIDRNIKVGHDEHFFIFVYCHRGPTINHRLIGMNFYISLHWSHESVLFGSISNSLT